MPSFLADLHPVLRIFTIALLAVLAHVAVRALQAFSRWIFTSRGDPKDTFARRFPKGATIITIAVSASTFTIYFLAVGLLFKEFGFSLTAYLASASVIGLAVGFGSQGLVQDFVIGLTLIFTDVLDVGDVVDISGQTGRVERIGLRFTTMVNLLEQKVYIPNRNIAQINRYRNGYVRAYVDVQLPDAFEAEQVVATITPLAEGMRAQHDAIVLTEPEIMGVQRAEPGGWRFLRIKFRLWPGQGALIENPFKQRVLAAMKGLDPNYADWMITVTYRAE
jgi:small conductance mechanosensitive channel